MANLGPVKFRMIVFRPFKGEIMLGKISSGTEHGIKSMYMGIGLNEYSSY
jgi:DNA-directed RNA polymerase subunit E'/Rpb7